MESYLKENTYKANWVRSLLKKGLDYHIVVLEHISDRKNLDEAERKWIAIGRAALGERFTNATDGGDGQNHFSDETKFKISNALRRYKRSPEHQAKLALVNVGRKLTDEHKEKLRQATKGRRLTPEHCAKIAAGRLGKKYPNASIALKKLYADRKATNLVAF